MKSVVKEKFVRRAFPLERPQSLGGSPRIQHEHKNLMVSFAVIIRLMEPKIRIICLIHVDKV